MKSGLEKWLGISISGTLISILLVCAFAPFARAARIGYHGENLSVGGILVPVSRAQLVVVPRDISQVIIADPDVADVHVVGPRKIAVIGKKIGHTNAKIFDNESRIIRQFDVIVSYDLPAIRRALHFFLPKEHIYVDLVNTSVALTGQVSDASVVAEAMRIVSQFTQSPGASGSGSAAGGATGGAASGAAGGGSGGASSGTTIYPNGDAPSVLNLLKVATGQQVMLRVRVGEIQRNALKNLGVSLSALSDGGRMIGATQNKLPVLTRR